MINIDQLILEATKNKSTVRKDTYRLIKAKFMEYSTSREGAKKPIDETIQLNILRKMKKELEEDINLYKNVKLELAEEYHRQLEIVQEFLPAEVSEEEILRCIDEYIANNGPIIQKQFGDVMKAISAQHPTANKAIISKLIKSRL